MVDLKERFQDMSILNCGIFPTLPKVTDRLRKLMLEDSMGYDWSEFDFCDSAPDHLSSSLVGSDGEPAVVVWTDGASEHNQDHRRASAGIGVSWGINHMHNIAIRVQGPIQSNNRAELLAFVVAVVRAPCSAIEVRTDSRYVIQFKSSLAYLGGSCLVNATAKIFGLFTLNRLEPRV